MSYGVTTQADQAYSLFRKYVMAGQPQMKRVGDPSNQNRQNMSDDVYDHVWLHTNVDWVN